MPFSEVCETNPHSLRSATLISTTWNKLSVVKGSVIGNTASFLHMQPKLPPTTLCFRVPCQVHHAGARAVYPGYPESRALEQEQCWLPSVPTLCCPMQTVVSTRMTRKLGECRRALTCVLLIHDHRVSVAESSVMLYMPSPFRIAFQQRPSVQKIAAWAPDTRQRCISQAAAPARAASGSSLPAAPLWADRITSLVMMRLGGGLFSVMKLRMSLRSLDVRNPTEKRSMVSCSLPKGSNCCIWVTSRGRSWGVNACWFWAGLAK